MIYELRRGGATVTLRLELDGERRQRALVHFDGMALSHAGPLGPLRELVLALAARLREPFTPTADALPIQRVTAIVAALAPDATLVARPAAATLPRWPSTLRTGAAPADRLWPFDAELAGLRLGLRRAVKRECFDDASEDADRTWLASQGVPTERVGPVEPDGRRVLLGGEVTDALRAAELRLRGGADDDAAAALGAALGYPPCCVERFLRGGRDDVTILAAHAGETGPASPYTQWINAPLALISHVPCSVRCEPSRQLGAAILAALDAARPGFADRWRPLAARLQVVDGRGHGLALAGDGDLATGFRITDAVRFSIDAIMSPVPDAVGRVLAPGDVIAAFDHRG